MGSSGTQGVGVGSGQREGGEAIGHVGMGEIADRAVHKAEGSMGLVKGMVQGIERGLFDTHFTSLHYPSTMYSTMIHT